MVFSWLLSRIAGFLLPFVAHLALTFAARGERGARVAHVMGSLFSKTAVRIGIGVVVVAMLAWLELGYASRWLSPDSNDLVEESIVLSGVLDHPWQVHSPELLSHAPYQINPYMPLTYGVYGLFQDPGAIDLRLARLWNFLALNLALLDVFLLARRVIQSRVGALACCLLFASWGSVLVLGIQIRPDVLALPWLCLALWLWSSGSRRADWYPLVLLVACGFKIMIWGTVPLLFASDLLARNGRRMLAWAATGVLLVTGLLLWNHFTDGGFYQHVIAVQRNLPRLPWLERELRESELDNGSLLTLPALLLFGTLLYEWLFVRSVDPFMRLARVYVIGAYAVAVALMRKWGAGNYYLEAAISAGVLAAALLRTISDARVAPVRRGALALSLAAVFALALQNRFPAEILSDHTPIRAVDLFEGFGHLFEQPTDPKEEELPRLFAGKVVLADTRSILRMHNLGATIFMNDPGCFNIEYLMGNLSAERAQETERAIAREVDFVVLDRPMEYWFGDPLRKLGLYEAQNAFFSRFEEGIRRDFADPFIITSRVDGVAKLHFAYRRAKKK